MKQVLYNEKNIDFKNIKTILSNGGTIIYPTDTVYGVGADLCSLSGINKIYEIKERNFNSPLIALISDIEYLEKIAIADENIKNTIDILAKEFWPGALTIILKKKNIIPDIMISNGETVGIRIPNLKIAQDIIESIGGILPTTSANISGDKTPRNYNELNEYFKSKADIIIESEKSLIGMESTIIDLTRTIPLLLREGAIKKEMLEKHIGKIQTISEVENEISKPK